MLNIFKSVIKGAKKMVGANVKSDYKEDLDRLKAVFTTTKGEFTLELYAKECPETVWNFVNLAEGRQKTSRGEETPFYDGLNFHRTINGFMIQGGCPDGTGGGSPGYTFKDEFDPNLRHDSEGILSMANRGAGTNGSQFFITLGPTPHLDGGHTVFGKVIEGMEIVRTIGAVETNYEDRPLEEVKIEKVTIVR